MITEKNIFEKGMLISLNFGAYKGRMQLSKEQMKDLPTEIVRGVHDLFGEEYKEMLSGIGSFDTEVRNTVKAMSVPFPIDGVYFINTAKLDDVINFLEEKKIDRENLIKPCVDAYDDAMEAFAEKYPEYYAHAQSKRKYLTKGEFKNRFYFHYQFFKISAPSKEDSFVTPEMYKREIGKWKETINEMKSEVLGIINSQLLEMTARLKSQCTGGKPSQRTFNSLNEFLTQIDNVYSDFLDHNQLKATIEKVKAQVLGVDADSLRNSESFKKKFGKEIGKIVAEIKAIPDLPLKRAIEF